MERALRDNELAVLRRLVDADRPNASEMRESLAHLVVDDECDCGCENFPACGTRGFLRRTTTWSHGLTRDRVTVRPPSDSCSAPRAG